MVALGKNAVPDANAELVSGVWRNATRPQENLMKQHSAMRNASCSASNRMRPARHEGYSLVEIMIVVALVATLAAITVPSVQGAVQQYALLTSGQQVVSTIRAARLQAVSRNQILKVRFDFPANGQYQVVNAVDAAVGLPQTLGQQIAFGAFTDVQFTTAGRLAAPVVITVTNGTAAQDRTINVSASGQVRLQ
jgi:prepilin-type N-terminal cleavage/methylation domain-containing protein